MRPPGCRIKCYFFIVLVPKIFVNCVDNNTSHEVLKIRSIKNFLNKYEVFGYGKAETQIDNSSRNVMRDDRDTGITSGNINWDIYFNNSTEFAVKDDPLAKKRSLNLINERISSIVLHQTISEPRSDEKSLENINIWHPFRIGYGDTYFESLHIQEIIWNKDFVYEHPVTEWTSVNDFAVGRFQNRLILAWFRKKGLEISTQETGQIVSAFSIFKWWDEGEKALKTIVTTAEGQAICWYRLTDEGALTQFWKNDIQNAVSWLKVLSDGNKINVLVTFDSSVSNNLGTVLYELRPWQTWWLKQKFIEDGPSAVTDDSEYIFIVDSKLSNLNCYHYSAALNGYILNNAIPTPGVATVSTFSSGPDVFVAIGADDSALYQIKGRTLRPCRIENYNLGYVEKFLTIKADVLRNSAILLFQQELDHSSHESKVVEGLRWNGNSFEIVEHSPCRSSGIDIFGFTCLVDVESHVGIKGATILTNDPPTIILSGEQQALAFFVKTKIVDRPDPINAKIKNTLQTVAQMEEKMKSLKKALDVIDGRLIKNPKKKLAGRNWVIQRLVVPSVKVNSNDNGEGKSISTLKVGGKVWSNTNSLKGINHGRKMKGLNDRLKEAFKSLSKAVKLTDSPRDLKIPFIFNKGISVKGNSLIGKANIQNINDVKVADVIQHAMKKSDDNKLHIEQKSFDKLIVKDLRIHESINGMKMFNSKAKNTLLKISADISFNKTVKISKDISLNNEGSLNNIHPKKDILQSSRLADNLSFEVININKLTISDQLNSLAPTPQDIRQARRGLIKTTNYRINELNFLEVEGDVQVEMINTVHWDTFIKNVVFRTQPIYLNNLRAKALYAKKSTSMSKLNSLQYPTSYLTRRDQGPIVISGKKVFKKNVVARKVYYDGTLNGIHSDEIITLKGDQNIGNVTFFNLNVLENVMVKGKIAGKNIEKSLLNPTLDEGRAIYGNVIFRKIFVDGPILVQNTFNGTNLQQLRKNVVYKDSRAINVKSDYEFDAEILVKNGFKTNSNIVTGKPLRSFLTTNSTYNSKKDINFNNASFQTLFVSGLFARSNLRKTLKTALFINKDQKFEGQLDFKNTNSRQGENSPRNTRDYSVDIKDFSITESCNNWTLKNNVLSRDNGINRLRSDSITFKTLRSKSVTVTGNIITDNKIQGIDLKEFDKNRLSINRDQVITAKYVINNCTCHGNIEAEYINSQPTAAVESVYRNIDDVESLVLTGKIPISYLFVQSMETNGINGKNLKEIESRAIALNKENFSKSNLSFIDPVVVDRLNITRYLNSENLPVFLNDCIHNNDNPISINGSLMFKNSIVVENSECNYLNNIDFNANILHRGSKNIHSNVQVLGDVIVRNNLNVSGYFNDEYFSRIDTTYENAANVAITSDIFLRDGHKISNLIAGGLINSDYDIEKILKSLVFLDVQEKNEKIDASFTQPVFLRNHLAIEKLYNNINVTKFINSIVYTNALTAVNGKVRFEAPVRVEDDITVNKELSSIAINGRSLNDWRKANSEVRITAKAEIQNVKADSTRTKSKETISNSTKLDNR